MTYSIYGLAQTMPTKGIKAYFFKNEKFNTEFSLCETQGSFYYCIDTSGLVYWFNEKSFCPQTILLNDTVSNTSSTITIKYRETLKQNDADFTFKISKRSNALFISKSGNREDQIKYCNLNNSITKSTVSIIDLTDQNSTYDIKLIKSDTTIKFANSIYHCYRIREQSSNASISLIRYIYLDKINLVPIYLIQVVIRKEPFAMNKIETNKYHLIATLSTDY
jgi:hypothetical protein